MHPFKRDYPSDPALEGQVHDLLAPLGAEQPNPETASDTQHLVVEAAAHPVAARGLGFRQRMVLGAAALITPLMAVTAVGAVAGDNSPVGAIASAVGMGGNSGDHRNDHKGNATASETATSTETATTTPTASTTPTGEEDGEEALSPHENGKGCDDKLFADNPDGPPFGHHDTPVGPCNEEEEEDEEASATAEPTEAAAEEDGEEKQDAHANGKGCDDKLFGDNPDGPPFGHHDTPVGPCKDDGEDDATATATASATPGAATSDSGNAKGNGKGKGKNK